MKIAIVFFVLGFCEGLIVGDWLRVRVGDEKPLKRAANTSERKLEARRKALKAGKAVAALK